MMAPLLSYSLTRRALGFLPRPAAVTSSSAAPSAQHEGAFIPMLAHTQGRQPPPASPPPMVGGGIGTEGSAFDCPLWPGCDCPGGTMRPECPGLNNLCLAPTPRAPRAQRIAVFILLAALGWLVAATFVALCAGALAELRGVI